MAKRKTPAINPVVLAFVRAAKAQGVTTYAIAKRAGCSISTAQRALAGEVSPTLDTATTIADALGLRLSVEPMTKR